MDGGPLNATYRVAEALPKDVGRGLARLDPKDMAELASRSATDRGHRQADDRGSRDAGSCRIARQTLDPIDGIARANAGARLGGKVKVRRAEAKSARRSDWRRPMLRRAPPAASKAAI